MVNRRESTMFRRSRFRVAHALSHEVCSWHPKLGIEAYNEDCE
jgi:hypothetical protein